MIKFFRFGEHTLPLPERASDGAAGYDLRSRTDFHLIPGDYELVYSGFGVELKPGQVGLIRDRSGLALRGITTRGGVIDSDYRGEIGVILFNEGVDVLQVSCNDRIAQLVILDCVMEKAEEITRPSTTSRGANGFGSTGQ